MNTKLQIADCGLRIEGWRAAPARHLKLRNLQSAIRNSS
jgi:hypothetical protein